jgi:hypothetical protein
VFGTHLGTAFCDVAIADAKKVLKVLGAVFGIERMHLERGCIYQKSRTDKFGVLFVIPKHVTDVLA